MLLLAKRALVTRVACHVAARTSRFKAITHARVKSNTVQMTLVIRIRRETRRWLPYVLITVVSTISLLEVGWQQATHLLYANPMVVVPM